MAAKNDKEAKEAAPAAADAAASAGGGGGAKAWLPVIAALVLAPAVSFAVAEYVLLPRLTAKLGAAPAAAAHGDAAADAPEPAASGHGGKKGEKEAPGSGAGTYEFQNVVVNLAGTMGTRYLKTSFVVTGKNVKPAFENDKARLTDITLSVLSSLTLADLEEAGAKNILREKLVGAYNQTFGKHLVDQVYFSDFVIQ